VDEKAKGVYTCSCCNSTLFHSSDNFNSGRGYLSFWSQSKLSNVGYKHHRGSWWQHPHDTGLHCENCGAHLGSTPSSRLGRSVLVGSKAKQLKRVIRSACFGYRNVPIPFVSGKQPRTALSPTTLGTRGSGGKHDVGIFKGFRRRRVPSDNWPYGHPTGSKKTSFLRSDNLAYLKEDFRCGARHQLRCPI